MGWFGKRLEVEKAVGAVERAIGSFEVIEGTTLELLGAAWSCKVML